MEFAAYGGEKKLSTLVNRLYDVEEGADAKAVAKAAADALLAANPELADLASLERGSPLTVPLVSGAKLAEETVAPEAAARRLVVTELRRALDVAMASLDESVEKRVGEAHETIALARSSELKALRQDVPEVKDRVTAAADTAKERIKEADELRGYRDKALEELHRDLDELAELLA